MSQQKQENQEDGTVLLLIFLLVSCLVTKIDERLGKLGRWSMENCMDGDGEQERRMKNVGDLDAKLEVEEEANGLWNVGSSALMAISISPKPLYLPFYSSLPSSFSLTLPLKPKSRSLKLLCCGLRRWWHWWAGGHIYPTITIADELKITNPNVQIHDSFSNCTRKISFENPKLLLR